MSDAVDDSLQNSNTSVLWKEIRIAVFSLLAVLIFTVFALTVGGGGAFWKPQSVYFAEFANLGGLKRGAPVSIRGMIAGRVSDIRFVKSNDGYLTRVTMAVDHSTEFMIREDSKVSIKAQGLMGDRYIEISGGSGPSRQLPTQGFIPTENQADFDRLTADARELMEKLSATTHEVEILVNNINQGKGTIGQFAQNQDLYDRAVHLLEEIESLVAEVKKHPKKFFKFSIF